MTVSTLLSVPLDTHVWGIDTTLLLVSMYDKLH